MRFLDFARANPPFLFAACACVLGVLVFEFYPGAGTLPPAQTAAAAYSLPLQGGGNSDMLSVGSCSGGSGWCLTIQPSHGSARTVPLPSSNSTARACGSHYTWSNPLEIIGNFTGDAAPEVAAVYCENGASLPTRTVLSIVDVSAGKVIASVEEPDITGTGANDSSVASLASEDDSYTDYPRDPSGKEYPFLAPGEGDEDYTTGGKPLWGFMCLFDPNNRIAGPRCGTTALTGSSFAKISTVPPIVGSYEESIQGFYRESGGWLQDLDNDGWEDISLSYHSLIMTISGKTGKVLTTTEYNIATDPKAQFLSPYPIGTNQWFHSGRNYGIKTAFNAPDGDYTVMISGSPVGSFTSDDYCGPSRYVGVLASPVGDPAARKLAWSAYYGFQANDVLLESGSWVKDRTGDMENGCINRFDSGITKVGGTDAVIYSYFTQAPNAPDLSPSHTRCESEQLTFYENGDQATQEWPSCANYFLKEPGTWAVEARNLRTGAVLANTPGEYLWGASTHLVPSGVQLYLVQNLPSQERFDMSDVNTASSSIQVVTLSNGTWHSFGSGGAGVFPVPGVPKITFTATDINPWHGAGVIGVNSGYAELTTRPDPDGLDDVQMADGTWVGWDTKTSRFIVKSPQCTLTATPSTVTTTGEKVVLTWSASGSSGVSSIEIGSAGSGSSNVATSAQASGSISITPSQMTTYTATAVGSDGLSGNCSASVSLDTAAAQTRDAERKSDLASLAKALAAYHAKYGTYEVIGSGASGTGIGFVSEVYPPSGNGTAVVSIEQGLINAGVLPNKILNDPLQGTAGYTLYLCDGGQQYALSATLENPSASDIANAKQSCNGTGANGTVTAYGKNYAVSGTSSASPPTPSPDLTSSQTDAQRKQDLSDIAAALEKYYAAHGTYLVSGAGYGDGGDGWVAYEGSTYYKKAITRILYEDGYLNRLILEKPGQENYMLYVCDGGNTFALSAKLDHPSQSDIAAAKASCNGMGPNGTYTTYGHNYAISSNTTTSALRDIVRKSNLAAIQQALEQYYKKYGTYKVAGAGYTSTKGGTVGDGNGWVAEKDSYYPEAITEALYNDGFLSEPLIDDPQKRPSYDLYLCNNNQTYALSATLENPSASDIAKIKQSCNGTGPNGTYTVYGHNYAVTGGK